MNWISLKAEQHNFGYLKIEQGPANILYYRLVVLPFLSICISLHEASTYIFQDMTKDLEVPFVPSKTCAI